MFRADKDIKLGARRGGRGRGSASQRGGEGRDEVLEKARRERAQREKARASRGQAVLIQRWYRGRSAAVLARAGERADWDRKMSDFGRLQRTLTARGIPFTPPLNFVLTALQQLLFFYRSEQDSARLCLFCESVLTPCLSQPDLSLNPAAHLAGVARASGKAGAGGGSAVDSPAFRLRLRRLLGACLDYVEEEPSKGVAQGNFPLKVLHMLTGSSGHAEGSGGVPGPGATPSSSPEVVSALASVSRSCLEILVFELDLFSATRQALLGGASERKAVSLAGSGTPLKLPPGRQGAILGCWDLALTALDAVGTICPPSTPTGAPTAAASTAAAAVAPLRAAFVSELLSVPLLPSRLGADGVDLLLKERTETFVDCLRDFRLQMAASCSDAAAAAAAAGGAGGGGGGGGEGGATGANEGWGLGAWARGGGGGAATEADPSVGTTATASTTTSTKKATTGEAGVGRKRGAGAGGGRRARDRGSWQAFFLPPPPVSCCATEVFLLGNVVALGTKLSIEGGKGGGERAKWEQREFMRAATSLLELAAIPDSLLTDRQAITWQNQEGGSGGGGGTTMTALAVPQAVQDQVRLLVADRWVRAVGKRALEGVNEELLQRCTEAERLESKETLQSSAANLAMASVQNQRKEARGTFSKWAEKLREMSMKWLSGGPEQPPPAAAHSSGNNGGSSSGSSNSAGAGSATSPPLPPPGGTGSGLIDASAASRAAASGQSQTAPGKVGGATSGSSGGGGQEGAGVEGAEAGAAAASDARGGIDPADRPHDYDADSILALSQLLSVMLRRWGTGANTSNQVMQGVLNTLCFSFPCVARLWAFVLNECSSFERLCDSAPVGSAEGGGLHASVAVMCCLFGHLLVVLDDAELYEGGRPLPLHHLRTLVEGLKRPLFAFCWDKDLEEKNERSAVPGGHFGTFYAGAAGRLLRGLYVRNSRRALCRSEAWVVPQAESSRTLAETKTLSARARKLLHAMPYCMSLTQRMRVFEHLVKADKGRHQPENTRGVPIRVRRGHVLEDGLAALGSGGRAARQTKKRLCVIYTASDGHEESGIDMGGLFKDFWTDLSALAFDVNYGLFKVTKEGLMYPNPTSEMVHGSEHLRLFEFLGRILGKALYEGITVQPEFATFFLGFIRGNYNYLHLFHDLHGLDPELYRNLMFLKTYNGGDVEDLCLTFTVADEAFGANTEVDLIPGGSRRAVTSTNRLEYVNRVAKHHLVDGVKPQAEAFVRGLWEVIDPQWLQMFSEPELQVLISGSNKTMDVEDLRRHTRYSGGFVGMDRTVRRFWSVVGAMSDKEKAALLRFVTSCERPPPLGFESMQPPFCVHRVGVRSDGERLPTASTCFNTLKLPTYSSEKVMKAKLLTSIFSGTGFELS